MTRPSHPYREGTQQASAVSLSELPQPFWGLLIPHHLDASSRAALFQTSKGLACIVMQHTKARLQPLGWKPTAYSDNSNATPHASHQGRGHRLGYRARQAAQQFLQQLALMCNPGTTLPHDRSAVLNSLAAGSSELHLHLLHQVLPLSTPVCNTITQLMLCNIPLNPHTISSLQLSSLANLHTLALIVTRSAAPTVDEAALGAAVTAGGLRQLRNLQCEGQEGPAVRRVIKTVGRMLGSQIKKLTTNRITALAALPSLPGLQSLHLRIRPPDVVGVPLFVPDEHATHLFSHPTLSTVSMPSYLHFSAQPAQVHQPKWQLLHLTTPGVRALLAVLPLEGVKVVKVEGGIQDGLHQANLQALALANLGKCGHTEWVPEQAGRKRWRVVSGIPAETPTLTISGCGLDAQEVAMCTQHLQGALVLVCTQPVSQQQLAALAVIPESVHTLVLKQWRLDLGCSWRQVCHAIPLHIKHLVVYSCKVSLQHLVHIFTRTAPYPAASVTNNHARDMVTQLRHVTVCQQPLNSMLGAACFLRHGLAKLETAAAEQEVVLQVLTL